ncbi:uncharacterized protein L201_002370 [Kwoniella dendrophila CBS 6074]|uniref:Phytanoyl-CoA dioxygenase n=1 Tax=Kwoniella dendrophila CBS 6074 TaxID=1295534 RepID=A0AAX4JSB0_9TREE
MATTAKSPSIVTLRLSEAERSTYRLSQRSLQTALEAMHRDGVLVIEDIVDKKAIDRLNERMKKDAITLMERGEDGPFNYNLGNLQQSPPYNDSELFPPSIFSNPIASQITSSLLGGKPTMSFISSNAAVKAEVGQPVHADADFAHPSIPFATVVNVGLIDMMPENGSTQVWLGTHKDTSIESQEGAHGERASGRIKLGLLERRKEISPPIQPFISKGSLVLRDLRLWHAGMPNKTYDIRIMLAMIHFAPWYRQRMTMKLPRSLRPTLDGNDHLNIAANWTDEKIDHLAGAFGNAFDFNQDP